MNPSRPSAFAKHCAAALAATLALLLPLPALAAPTGLAVKPLQSLNRVKPNIMFTVDDSGSMSFEFMPDFTAEGPPPLRPASAGGTGTYYCRDRRNCGGIVDPSTAFRTTVAVVGARAGGPADSQRRLQQDLLQSVGHLQPRQARGRHRPSLRRQQHRRAPDRGPPSTATASRDTPAPIPARTINLDDRLSGHGLVQPAGRQLRRRRRTSPRRRRPVRRTVRCAASTAAPIRRSRRSAARRSCGPRRRSPPDTTTRISSTSRPAATPRAPTRASTACSTPR